MDTNLLAPLVRGHLTLTADQQKELIKRAQSGDKLAEDQLFRSVSRYVLQQALRMGRKVNNTELIEDLFQHGMIGVQIAVKKFDASKNVVFITYASNWIKAQMMKNLINDRSLIKFGTTQAQRKVFSHLNKLESHYFQTHPGATQLDPKWVAEQLNVPLRDAESALTLMGGAVVSYDQHDAEDRSMLDTLPGDTMSPEEKFDSDEERRLNKEKADAMIATLDERSQFIIKNRVMVDPEDVITLDEIGKKFGVSRERARQLEVGAIKRMRQGGVSVSEPKYGMSGISYCIKGCGNKIRAHNKCGICTKCQSGVNATAAAPDNAVVPAVTKQEEEPLPTKKQLPPVEKIPDYYLISCVQELKRRQREADERAAKYKQALDGI